MNKRSIEILLNLEILCFLDKKKKKKYYNYLTNKNSKNQKGKNLMMYIKKYLLKKYKDLYLYGELIKDILN